MASLDRIYAGQSRSPMSESGPRFSVVIATFNRVDGLERAISSVLSQDYDEFEVVIVNDGSTDSTADYLKSLTDPRLMVLERPNGGLSAARNTGIARATGDWMVFLDDDDWALPGWLAAFASLITDANGAVTVSAQYYTPDGEEEFTAHRWDLGPEFGNLVATSLAGAFAVRSDLVRELGGFEERMTCSHQTEFWLRLVPLLERQGLGVGTADEIRVALEVRPPDDRVMSNPKALITGTEVLLEKHEKVYADHRDSRADLLGVVGVSHARLGHWRRARSALFRSAKDDPMNLRRWMRLLAATVPAIGKRLWDTDAYSSGDDDV